MARPARRADAGLLGGELVALPSSLAYTERSYAAGDIIFKGGDPGQELLLVRRGIVRVRLSLKGGGYYNLVSFGRGNFFGEISFLTREARSAEAVATTATGLYVIDRTLRRHRAGVSAAGGKDVRPAGAHAGGAPPAHRHRAAGVLRDVIALASPAVRPDTRA